MLDAKTIKKIKRLNVEMDAICDEFERSGFKLLPLIEQEERILEPIVRPLVYQFLEDKNPDPIRDLMGDLPSGFYRTELHAMLLQHGFKKKTS